MTSTNKLSEMTHQNAIGYEHCPITRRVAWPDLSPTGLRLPPAHPAFGVEDGDGVLDEVAVGVTVAVVGLPGVTGEALLFLLAETTAEEHIGPGPHAQQA